MDLGIVDASAEAKDADPAADGLADLADLLLGDGVGVADGLGDCVGEAAILVAPDQVPLELRGLPGHWDEAPALVRSAIASLIVRGGSN